ncbi:MAG: iron ABC transporter permease [Bacteriovorax sp.]|nr:iron ABC transporter permease [Bacteriovorax sp.]
MNSKNIFLVTLVAFFAIFLLVYGETGFNLDLNLIWQLRLPKVTVCFFAGGMLAIAGLLMQIFFQNPLAGPDILGVSSGSSLFVAFWMMASVGFSQSIMDWGMSAMSFLGALTVFFILVFFVNKNMSRVSLIITGLLISSFASSGISILVSMSQALQLKNYLVWSMGSFRNVTGPELPRFIFLSLISTLPVLFFIKSLNQFLLSENYAKSMGVNVKRMRLVFVSVAALQISVVTLFCGPIGFIGIISPHLARQFLKRSQLSVLLPAVFFIGVILSFVAETIIVLTPSWSISVNAILGLIGAPVIVLYLYRQREWSL